MPPVGRASLVSTAALAAAVFASYWFNAGYYPIAAGILGAAAVVIAAAALLIGIKPSAPSGLTAVALLALAAWAGASVTWGGLPNVALRFAGLAATGAAAALLGSVLGTPGLRRVALVAVWAATVGNAVLVLVVSGAGASPRDWFDGRQLEGAIGYHNAQGAAYAIALPIALWLAAEPRRAVRGAGSASAVVLLGAALLTQSRGALLAIMLAVMVQLSISRRARVAAMAVLLVPCGALLFQTLREVDDALLEIARADSLDPADGPLARYALTTALTALVLGCLAMLPVPSVLWGKRARAIVISLAAVAAVGAVTAGVILAAGRTDDLLDRLTAEPNSPSQVQGGETRLSSISPTGRIEQWRLATEMAHERVLAGHGTGTFAARWGIERDNKDLYVLQPHSIELEVVAELGIVGGALFGGFLAGLVWLVIRGARADRQVAAVAAGVVTAFVALTSVDWTFSFPSLLAVTLLVAGAAGGRSRGRPVNAFVVLAASLASIALLAAPALGAWYLERSRATSSFDEAWHLAARARTFNRLDPEIVRYQGLLAEGAKNYLQAAALYRRAAELAQQPWTDQYRLARALHSAGRITASRRACKTAIVGNPLEPELRRGVCAEAG